MLAKRLGLRSA